MTIQLSGPNGNIAKVTDQGRLEVRAATETLASRASTDGNTFFFASGDVNVTSQAGNETILSVTNTRDEALIIDDIRVSSDGQGVFSLRLNVEADNALGVGDGVNANAGSNKKFDGTVAVGDGSTTAGPTGGEQFGQAVFGSQGGIEDIMTVGAIRLLQGNNLNISFDASSNVEAGATVIAHYEVESS